MLFCFSPDECLSGLSLPSHHHIIISSMATSYLFSQSQKSLSLSLFLFCLPLTYVHNMQNSKSTINIATIFCAASSLLRSISHHSIASQSPRSVPWLETASTEYCVLQLRVKVRTWSVVPQSLNVHVCGLQSMSDPHSYVDHHFVLSVNTTSASAPDCQE